MKKKIILMAILAASLLMGACSGKYMLSGTWYSDEKTMRTFVFYDNGEMKINNKAGSYEMEGKDTILIRAGDTLINATIDRDTEMIQCPQDEGLPVCLYKDIGDAKTAAAEKTASLNREMERLLNGRWIMTGKEEGKTVAVFDGERLIMTTVQHGQKASSSYKLEFLSKKKVRFIAGREIVAEFDLETDGKTLTFSDGKITTRYIKENA